MRKVSAKWMSLVGAPAFRGRRSSRFEQRRQEAPRRRVDNTLRNLCATRNAPTGSAPDLCPLGCCSASMRGRGVPCAGAGSRATVYVVDACPRCGHLVHVPVRAHHGHLSIQKTPIGPALLGLSAPLPHLPGMFLILHAFASYLLGALRYRRQWPSESSFWSTKRGS